jgi:hypothetical protein
VPVAQTRGHAGKALLIASVSVVLLLGLALLVALGASRGDVDVHLGDDRFDAGKASHIADSIDDEHGLPLLYADLVNRGRPLFVQHLSTADDKGWVAFGAFVPEDPRCTIDIDREAKVLRDHCHRSRTFPLDGTGLRHYPVTVEDGRLYVDINEQSTTSTTSAPPSTTSGPPSTTSAPPSTTAGAP